MRRAAGRRHTTLSAEKSGKTYRAGKTKGSTKSKARTRNTSKALPFGGTKAKNDVVCIESPSSDVTRRRKNAVRQGDAVPGELAGDDIPLQKDSPLCGTKTAENIGVVALASDPISDTLTQIGVSAVSPPREKKRSFAQAELEEVSPNHEATEDDLRRNQGPPKATTGGEPEGTTDFELKSQPSDGKHELREETPAPPGTCEPVPPAENPAGDLREATTMRHQSAPRTARCRALPDPTFGKGNQGVPCEDAAADAPIVGRYGVISLFDGVSTVMPILKKKFGYPPVAAILAECDLSLRELVCTEFGYRSDEKWGYTLDGSAVLYLKDVHVVISNNCRLLKELVQMFPDCKWIIVGGSPCQDLTFAGPLRGVLGLIGPSSRLFFVLLCVISAMQRLVGPAAVRYLVENAASMLQIHLDAFCRLLGLPLDQHGRYIWDPCDFGFQIARRRNFFRNFDDTEAIKPPMLVFGQDFGPLVDQSGNNISFAPLLRTREFVAHGMLRSSWTLYQPHALVWNYAYWNGRTCFGKACKLGPNRLPNLKWEQVIPPPFLKAWFKSLQICESRCVRGKDMDAIISPLLPLFHCQCYSIPFRVLTEEEVSALSGLHGIWTRISPEDAEALPERLVCDYCGNCFHPALISSALGKNETLRRWVTAGDGGPNALVADQSEEAFQVFARLCDQVEAEAKHRVKKEKVDIDRTLPPFQTLEPCGAEQRSSHVVSEKPDVLSPSMVGYRKVRVTKTERHIQHCIDAALHKLEGHQCLALRACGLERIFDGLRATCFVPFFLPVLLGKIPQG